MVKVIMHLHTYSQLHSYDTILFLSCSITNYVTKYLHIYNLSTLFNSYLMTSKTIQNLSQHQLFAISIYKIFGNNEIIYYTKILIRLYIHSCDTGNNF